MNCLADVTVRTRSSADPRRQRVLPLVTYSVPVLHACKCCSIVCSAQHVRRDDWRSRETLRNMPSEPRMHQSIGCICNMSIGPARSGQCTLDS